jgi:hypothetical protein
MSHWFVQKCEQPADRSGRWSRNADGTSLLDLGYLVFDIAATRTTELSACLPSNLPFPDGGDVECQDKLNASQPYHTFTVWGA